MNVFIYLFIDLLIYLFIFYIIIYLYIYVFVYIYLYLFIHLLFLLSCQIAVKVSNSSVQIINCNFTNSDTAIFGIEAHMLTIRNTNVFNSLFLNSMCLFLELERH